MTLVRAAALAACVVLGSAACEKSSPPPRAKPSGALTQAETGLLSRLPAGDKLVFGGNFYDAQRWMAESPLSQFAASSQTSTMKTWNTCLAEQKQMSMAMSIGHRRDALQMAVFMKGLSIEDLRRCGERAGMTLEVDPDGKFATIHTESQPGLIVKAPYLAVDGGVYARMSFDVAALGAGALDQTPIGRADLEADQASLASGSMATDPTIQALLAKVDRSRAFYFAGSAAGTPLADKIGDVWGSFSIEHDLSFDGTFALKEPGAVDDAVRGWGELNGKLGQLPAGMSSLKALVHGIRLRKSGDGLEVSARISNRTLSDAMKQLGPLMQGFQP